MAYAEYFDSLDEEDRVDWSAMPLTYWAGSEETKEKRQAEFLVHDWFPFASIDEIGVRSMTVGEEVEKVLRDTGFNPRVSLQPSWYY